MRHIYPIVTTPMLREARDFYIRVLDAKVLFQQDWYIHLSVAGWEIGFLRPNHPQRLPVFQHATVSRGLCLALEVDNVVEMFEQLTAKGVEMLGPLRRTPGGDPSFSLMDPAGVVINVVERHGDPTSTFEV